VQWLAAAVIVQAVGLGLSAWLWHARAPLSAAPVYADWPYETQTSAPVEHRDGTRVRVAFAPNVTLTELQGLLHAAGAQIASGPSERGIYTLTLAADSPDGGATLPARILQLRANPDVLFVIPLRPDSSPSP
jgi:hypothetical protein